MHSARHRVQSPPAEGTGDAEDAQPAPAAFLAQLGTARSDWPMDRQAAATLPGRPASAAVARRFVRITAAMWRLSAETVADVELCMSELVTNAVTHTASRRVHCRLWSARGVLFLEVDDEGVRDRPQAGAAGEEDEHGRGMVLVETFTAAWGTLPRPGYGGKTVWAALLLPRG
ncbi:ATP-binding protein [Streptacidiphilus sp. PB12-B1b]|uniref:ATP-binding protein n=1 Tax=Streptacidiphilus sp. PB12-B1b TaxID=2705012 RepID=UPI0015FA554F|nr:ATP-binding protein [Streptacidiphilus sp. PB12-B1b]QMU79255.1 ATP-binding protein [Streptacidiphilus sp. PB12-B1b]